MGAARARLGRIKVAAAAASVVTFGALTAAIAAEITATPVVASSSGTSFTTQSAPSTQIVSAAS